MSSRVLAGSIALRGDWDEGEDGWKAEMDDNLLWLSVLTQGRFVDVVSVLPGSPAQGMVYVLASGAASHANEIAVYDEGAWHYRAPVAGWRLFNTTLGVFFQFGTAWVADAAALTAEDVRDVIGAALVSGSNVTVTPNDGSDTITIAADSGLTTEQIQDMLATFLTNGSNVTLTYDDAANTLTVGAALAATPSFGNGSGERRPYVGIAVTAGTFGGIANYMLTAAAVSSFFWNTQATAAGLKITFDNANVLTGLMFMQDLASSQGHWSIEGSNDDSSYTTLVADFDWTTVAKNNAAICTVTWSNTVAYKYYRLTKISGSTNNSAFVVKIDFRCNPIF